VAALPPYELIDLGALSPSNSCALAINDNAQVAGYSYNANGYQRAFVWETNTMRDLGTWSTNTSSAASGINGWGQVAGYSYTPASSNEIAVLWRDAQITNLGSLGGSNSRAQAINSAVQVAGYSSSSNGSPKAFLWETNQMRDLMVGTNSAALGINGRGQVVGSYVASGLSRPFLWQTNALQDLGSLGGNEGNASGINDLGQVVGRSTTTEGQSHAFLWQSSQMQDLGTLGGPQSCANAINNGGWAVGYAVRLNSQSVAAAFVEGGVLDLNVYLPDNTDWSYLAEAKAVNNLGGIVGYGYMKNGKTRAFLLQPKWIVGESIPIPPGAIDPDTGKPYREPDYTPLDAFVWGPAEGKLYPKRSVPNAQVKWYDTKQQMDATGTNMVLPRFAVAGACVWPDNPQLHVAGVPVQLEPPQSGPGYRFVNLDYTTSGATVNSGLLTFASPNAGYSVLRYLVGVPPGQTPNPEIYTSLVQVVRTIIWDAPGYLVTDQRAVVGSLVADPTTNRPPAVRSGFVLYTNAYYDSTAYNRETQTGPIIPVNAIDKAGTQDDLVVAFFHSNRVTSVDWPDTPVYFKINWPTNVEKIVIADGQGSGTLDALEYRDMQIYNQPDPLLPGFNPNEEHAFLAPSATGPALFALRDDLNGAWGLSFNYVLLKYRPAETNEWRMKVFQVVAEDGDHRFQYAAEAGKEIQPPYALGQLPLCLGKTTVTSGRTHRDYAGRIYARAADTPDTPDPNITIRYYYPLMPAFYYDTNREPGVKVGDCIAWLDHRAPGALSAPNSLAGTYQVPVDVTYHVSWPSDTPTLQLGETLLSSKGGLPGIKKMASAELVFDTQNPDGLTPTNAAVRMFDPLSARVLPLTNVAGVSTSYRIPAGVRRQTVANYEVFLDLPYVLRSRLSYDPLNKTLSFKGRLDESGVGEPLLLPNVMSARERDRIKQLSAESKFQNIIDALYRLTRNPNQVDVLGSATRKSNLVPTDSLLIGFMNKFTLNVRTNANVQINYLKTGTPEISVAELRRLEATNAVNQNGSSVTVFVRAAYPDAPITFTRVEVAVESFGDQPKALTAGLPLPAGGVRYLTVVENDKAALSGLPVSLKLIALTNTLFKGDVKILYPDNVLDEKLTLRHSLDFAGAPENAEFEWYYHPDVSSFRPIDLPKVATDGRLTDTQGWQLFNVSAKQGVNDITLGDGAQTSLFTLQDNWFILRYRYISGGVTNWSDWVGDPASGATPRAILAEGWIKRVIKGINQYEARVKDFHATATATYASMLVGAGQRYEGDIALNPDPANLNQIGLIETYETILNRGKNLSINGIPAIDSDSANNALLLAASRVADLYMLLGNEAFADAADPLVMFTTDNGVYGSLAPSIFCFQNQLNSLLEEELALLRGRDDSAAGVGGKPIYNRLFWNFTTGEGEVAYAQTYNITDQNGDGIIDEYDARILYPQGHGDAWGHYLTATTTYYNLLRHPRYTWVPRTESILVAGASVSVDFLDERKFAAAAAAKARTGVQLVDLTYRSRYVDDPAGQWQGYKDSDTDRAWGMTEWARRAGQAAYFDWLTANAILPAQDTNHVGLQKIDRTTVEEVSEIQAQYAVIQAQMDKADTGLNPLGLAKNVVPFDIDPIQVAQDRLTHFEQLSARAVKMMNNAVRAWNEVNQLSEALRRNQDSVQNFTGNINDQERDYKNRLIEIFGYPYAGDIGPGQTYPSGYDGPDLYHYMYVGTTDLSGESAASLQTVTAYYTRMKNLTTGGSERGDFFFPGDYKSLIDARYNGNSLEVTYPLSAANYGFKAPAAWGQRQAAGEIQMALSDIVQADAALRQSQINYHNLMRDIDDALLLLQAHYNLQASSISILNTDKKTVEDLDSGIAAARSAQKALSIYRDNTQETVEALAEYLPKAVGLATDATSAGRGSILTAGNIKGFVLGILEVGSEATIASLERSKDSQERQTSIELQKKGFKFEIQQELQQLESKLREEALRRVEAFSAARALEQAAMRYSSAVAQGVRLMEERIAFRKKAAAETQISRYKDMAFRIFRNDALQKYRAQFDLAARYVYLAATAYDYEVNLLGSQNGSGRQYLTDIVRQRSLGQMRDGMPVVGVSGLADPLARLNANFEVLKGQMGFLTPEVETGRFSLRSELFRIRPSVTNGLGTITNPDSEKAWRDALKNCRVANLWDVPEFRRYCRSFAPESAGPQPGLVIRFPTTITFGLNLFGWPLSGGDSAYDSSRFATRVSAPLARVRDH
jgi:probable HAF family extracellular repeat protein